MKRLILTIATLVLLTQAPGCGPSSSEPADIANAPNEVQEYEKRREMERTKGVRPKAATGSTGTGGPAR